MVSTGNKELLFISDEIYFYSLPLFLKVTVYFILFLLMCFVTWSGVNLIERHDIVLGYALISMAIISLIVTFLLIFKNKSFGRYFGLDRDGIYFNNYKDKKKWLFVPWSNVFHVKKEVRYASRSYVIELSLVSNEYEMSHYFRVNGDPFWNKSSGKIKVAYSRIPFQTKELLNLIQIYCGHCNN